MLGSNGFRWLGPLVALVALVIASAAQDPARRPNVVWVMADELGYYELSCLGHPHIETPNLDRMVAEGIRFTHAYAGSSLCAPTRAVLMTGKHTGHSSVRTNGGGTPLRADEVTVAAVLKGAGYATGGFGKWGCGGRGSTGVPERHGFDEFVGYYDQVHAHSYYPPYIIDSGAELPLAGNEGGSRGRTYSHYVIMERAKAFIRANRARPFFCYLPVTPPHGLFDIPDTDPAWARYAEKPWPEPARRYAAMVTMVDRQVGELLALLGELGLDRDTLVVFSGDNGGVDYFRSPEHPRGFHAPNVDPRTGVAFRGQKGTLYEGGLRIPMIARWPGHVAAGRVSDRVWSFADVLPTLAELAAAKVPAGVDGHSVLPELIGAEAAGRGQAEHEFLYWELGERRAVRSGRWKAVRTAGAAASWELYDLTSDPTEAHDVAAERPEVLARLRTLAESAHVPAVEGTFTDRTLHERDRRAKWGPGGPPEPARARARAWSRAGLLDGTKVVRASSESTFNGKLAGNAIDGDPRTIWHTRWRGAPAPAPHELVLDLGGDADITGLRYLARQDGGWNGAFGSCEVFVSATSERFPEPAVARFDFKRDRDAQEAGWTAVRGRYLLLRILTEAGGGPWASAAEIGVLGRPVVGDDD